MKNIIIENYCTAKAKYFGASDSRLKLSFCDKYQGVFWNIWEDEDEDVGTDYSYGIINKERSQILIDLIKKYNSASFLYFVGDVGESIEKSSPPICKLDLTYESFMNFQEEEFLGSGLTTKLYIFDESLSWIIHIDESVLIIGEDAFMKALIEAFGGIDSVFKKMESDSVNCSGYSKQWREAIIRHLDQNKSKG